MPLIEVDYSKSFDFNYNQYGHYLDAVTNKIDPFENLSAYDTIYGLTSLENYLFMPVGMYIGGKEETYVVC